MLNLRLVDMLPPPPKPLGCQANISNPGIASHHHLPRISPLDYVSIKYTSTVPTASGHELWRGS